LIVDDTVIPKAGRKIEFIGKLFDHVIKHWVLGFKLLVLAFWDGNSLIPLHFSYHAEKGKNKKYSFGLLKRQSASWRTLFQTAPDWHGKRYSRPGSIG
jgi:hypothetical protein